MKQWIIIIVAISVIIGFNCWQSSFLGNTSKYVLTDINDVEIYGLRNDTLRIKKSVEALYETWESIKCGWDVFAEHDSVEEIDESIQKIKICAELGEINLMLIENSILKEEIKRVVDMESFKFSNVF